MLADLLSKHRLILAECAIAERLRRMDGITLHPTLFNTPFIYGPPEASDAMAGLYLEYLETARMAGLPLLLTAPTWRLDAGRITAAGAPRTINTDAVAWLATLRERFKPSSPVLVGALTGPRSDCYRPDLAPDPDAAEDFHSHQIGELAATTADFLLAQTLPAVGEALGVARAMAATSKPYLISFCTGTDGNILDGTPLPDAMGLLDSSVARPPVGYMVNCTHPRFLLNAYPPGALKRLAGIQANGSAKDVTRLDGARATEAEPVADWVRDMLELHTAHGVSILGGCCGTSVLHMQGLAGGGGVSPP